MSTRDNLQTLESDVSNTRRDFEKTIGQINRTVENTKARFDPMRVIRSHPYAAGAAAVLIGGFLGFRGRSSKEFLTPAARTLIVSAAASAFWAVLNK
jgi:hypothetical protein